MDIDLGVNHCQREEAILTTTQEDETVSDSEGIPATGSKRARARRKTAEQGLGNRETG